MRRLIALIRGVTPAGKNRVPMEKLRETLHQNGFPGARTWIQSGNVVLDTQLSPGETAEALRRMIREWIGPDLAVIVKTAEELSAVLAGNPFPDLAPDRVFYTQGNGELDLDRAAALQSMDFGEERLAITPRAAYLYIPGSAARSRLSNNFLERRLGVPLTTRNCNTLRKLIEMAGEELAGGGMRVHGGEDDPGLTAG